MRLLVGNMSATREFCQPPNLLSGSSTIPVYILVAEIQIASCATSSEIFHKLVHGEHVSQQIFVTPLFIFWIINYPNIATANIILSWWQGSK